MQGIRTNDSVSLCLKPVLDLVRSGTTRIIFAKILCRIRVSAWKPVDRVGTGRNAGAL